MSLGKEDLDKIMQNVRIEAVQLTPEDLHAAVMLNKKRRKEASDTVAKLWDEMPEDERCKVMGGKVMYAIMEALEMVDASTADIEDLARKTALATRAAWIGYCAGKGWLKEDNSEL